MADLTGSIAVFGATSGIARAVALRLAGEGASLVLIGRDGAGLEALAALASLARDSSGAKDGGPGISCVTWDVLDFGGHAESFRALTAAHTMKGVFFAVGTQFPQDECEKDPAKARLTFDTNLTGPVVILDLFAAYFRGRGGGFISCISSVAGERGRGKVLTYAASKAGLTAYLAGLRHRLAGTGVFVQTLKPGFVRTRLTAGMESPLMAEPAPVARDIVRALAARREEVYIPGIWKWIMLIIRNIPAPIFRRMKL